MNQVQIVVCAMLVAVAAAAPPREEEVVPILYHSSNGPEADGSYAYKFETGNGISVSEQGEPRKTQLRNSENEYPLYVQGQYAYTAPDGTPIAVSYVADEFGFYPTGEHLPVAIQRALEYNLAHRGEEHHEK